VLDRASTMASSAGSGARGTRKASARAPCGEARTARDAGRGDLLPDAGAGLLNSSHDGAADRHEADDDERCPDKAAHGRAQAAAPPVINQAPPSATSRDSTMAM
jgi:hypothetical protein